MMIQDHSATQVLISKDGLTVTNANVLFLASSILIETRVTGWRVPHMVSLRDPGFGKRQLLNQFCQIKKENNPYEQL